MKHKIGLGLLMVAITTCAACTFTLEPAPVASTCQVEACATTPEPDAGVSSVRATCVTYTYPIADCAPDGGVPDVAP
jgi:hypothetical protein